MMSGVAENRSVDRKEGRGERRKEGGGRRRPVFVLILRKSTQLQCSISSPLIVEQQDLEHGGFPRGRWHVSDDVSRDVDPHSAARGRDCPFAMAAGEALCLYRAMQRSARKFTNYNVRECVLGRRVPSALPRAVGSEP
jgi:hypothetical protein